MIFRGKNISEYTAIDIQSLIDNKVPESKILDYKREINFDERSKTELIYDISSFYNTDGGCMIIGLDEVIDESNKKTGLPKLPDSKIKVTNFDELKSRIEEIIKQSTNPQIINLLFSCLIEIDGSNIYMIGIPKTKSLPSMVTYSNHNRFFKRKSNGKYTLDTYELYETFLQLGELENRITEFIDVRQGAVASDRFWQGIGGLHSLLIHTIPQSLFSSQIENFSSDVFKQKMINILKVPGPHSFSYRYCLEGFQLYTNRDPNDPHEISSYNLVHRNGCIEGFTNGATYEMIKGSPNLYADELLQIIKEQIENSFTFYSRISIDFPFYLSIKINNTKNLSLVDQAGGRQLGRIQHHSLQLPVTLLSSDKNEIKKQIKNALDFLWQSFGMNACPQIDFDKIFNTFTLNKI